VLTADELEVRREAIAASPDLQALLERLLARARAVAARRPPIPSYKGMLTADGGVCPDDHVPLSFDPWSPEAHCCPRCGREVQGERHDWRWAWLAHLWQAERIAEAAMVGALAGDDQVLQWAAGQVGAYGGVYLEFPNADNVLGPSRLFSSTYLESIWLTSYLAGAFLLRECGVLDEAGQAQAGEVAGGAADLIGEFDEGLSNRQTWHNAALAAVSVWFEDEDLATRALTGPRGLVGHLVDGFGHDGMWYEGENYHLFALRGLLTGAGWARLAGTDLFEEAAGRQRLIAALRAPTLSALPDGTFPARKDARFGVSLAQPMYLELWEHGLARLWDAGEAENAADLAAWLRHLYRLPAPAAEVFDSYLHESGEPAPPTRTRRDLSWWSLAAMAPELPETSGAWAPASTLLPEQGVAVLRDGDRYASVECGEYGGGHGHPDRLHLTLHARGVHWLADPGTGSYVSPDLFWYRSTLAHNAPRLDGVSQPPMNARADMFDVSGRWGWIRGKADRFTRTTVAGPAHLVDVVEFADDEEHLVELAWHPDGVLTVLSPGRWEPAELNDRFVRGAERFIPDTPGPVAWRSEHAASGRTLAGIFDGEGDLLRAAGPARPGRGGEESFLVRRRRGRYVRFAAVVDFESAEVRSARFAPAEIVVDTPAGVVRHRQSSEGWEVEQGDTRVALRGLRRDVLGAGLELPVVGGELHKYTPPSAIAFHVAEPPPLDGSLSGFITEAPLELDHEDQYRRTEEPYPGPEVFSARAWLAWDERALYLAVSVAKEDLVLVTPDAPPLQLDNEPDRIHADGLQVYLQVEGEPPRGWLLVPDPAGGLSVQGVGGTAGDPSQVQGGWRSNDEGYVVTVALRVPGWPGPVEAPPRFDLVVNEMRPDRLRRLGQLVWTGGGGWAYLRGDRQDPTRFGRIMFA
jgi:hypothetical protein